MGWLVTGVSAVIVSYGLTALVRRYALARHLLDVPNERSSHTRPTPRGGGIAFVLLVLLALLVLPTWVVVPATIRSSLVVGGALVALGGWLDDKRRMARPARLFVHLVAAGWVLYSVGGLPVIWLGPWTLTVGYWGTAAAVLGIVWATNLYNFMDGIDGLAGTQGLIVAVVAGVLLQRAEALGLAAVTWMLAAAVAGFLPWNWSPARIFMGSVGSEFLGFFFAALAVGASRVGILSVFAWGLLMAVFLIDATATLARRILSGERWLDPHRSHAYQGAVQRGLTPSQVTAAVVGIDLVLAIVVLVSIERPVLFLSLGATVVAGLLILWYVASAPQRPRAPRAQPNT